MELLLAQHQFMDSGELRLDMLRFGPYPQHLKDRISEKRGHISNKDAAELLDACDAKQLQWACLGHLSATNNSPEVALATLRERHGDRFALFCADRYGATRLPKISRLEYSLQTQMGCRKGDLACFSLPSSVAIETILPNAQGLNVR